MAMQREVKSGVFGGFVVALYLFFSFRLIALPFLIAATVANRRAKHATRPNRCATILWVLFFPSLLSPVDINLLGMYRGGGEHRSGPRLVRCVVGMPAHTALIARYGEYYSLGCSGYTLYSPRWMLVLF